MEKEQYIGLIGAIEMNTQAVALINRNMDRFVNEIKDIKVEMQGLRRNTAYIKVIAEILWKKNSKK